MNVLDNYEIIKSVGDFPYDDFALARKKDTNKIVIIYAYDGGYGYPSWPLDDLLESIYSDLAKAIDEYCERHAIYDWGIIDFVKNGGKEDESRY